MRVQTRDSISLILVAIASSASLILLIFFFQPQILEKTETPEIVISKIAIPVLGILFPLIAILWREITFRYIHRHDDDILTAIVLLDFPNELEKEVIDETLLYKERRKTRLFLLRIMMILPILGWVIVVFDHFILNWYIGLGFDIAIVLYIIWKTSKAPHEFDKNNLPDFLKKELDSQRS